MSELVDDVADPAPVDALATGLVWDFAGDPAADLRASGERALEGGSVAGAAVRCEHELDRQLEHRA